jgi:PEP-CTERM motif
MAMFLRSCRLTKLAGLAALLVSLAVSGPAYALTQDVIWDLGCVTQPGCQNTSYASPNTFTSLAPAPTYQLVAFGFNADNSAHSLFSKFTLGDPTETGLGLVNVPNNEIGLPVGQPGGQYVDLVRPTVSAPGWTLSNLFHLVVSSDQAGEIFNVYRSNGPAGAGSLTGLLFANQQHGSPNCVGDICTYDIDMTGFTTLAIQAVTGDVLVETFTTQQTQRTPEAATLFLLGLGLFVTGFARRRKV